MNVLFLCAGNSCCSILAEATFNHLALQGWRAVGAGSQPAGYTTLRHRIEGFFALPLLQLQNKPDELKQAIDKIASVQ